MAATGTPQIPQGTSQQLGGAESDSLPASSASGARAVRRIAAALGLAVLSGVLATLAFPPFGLWPLIFVAFVPMVVAQHRVAPPRWSGVMVGVGVGAYFAGQLSVGLHQDSVAIVFQLFPLYVGVFVAAVAWRSRRFQERTAYRWFIVSVPVAWVALDFLRAASPVSASGGTWANPVYALYSIPSFLQPVSIFGIYGLELLLLVVNWTLALVVIGSLDRRHEPNAASWRRARSGVAAAAGATLAWGALSVVLLDSPGDGDDVVRVAAVQTGVDGRDGSAEGEGADLGERYLRDVEQTREAAADGAELVVWSENGLPFDPQEQNTDELRDLAAETGTNIVIGYGGFENDEGLDVNELVLLRTDGTFTETFGKDHPGTFAGDYSDTGGTHPVHETSVGPVGTVICYDLDFTDTARAATRNGARLIAAPSSDVTAIADTHYTHLVFRSIENRVSTVKADSRFDSAIVDPWGRIVEHTANPSGQKQATLVADVPLGSGTSVFVTLGDWVGWVSVVGMVGFLAYGLVLRSGRRRREIDGPVNER